jgi:hypothetical protein
MLLGLQIDCVLLTLDILAEQIAESGESLRAIVHSEHGMHVETYPLV